MENTGASRVRGTIVKAPDSTPGLLFVQGQQKSFTLEGVWKSPVAPVPNMIVDVDLDASGSISGLTAVDQHQLSKERMSQVSGAAQEQGKQAVEFAKKGVGAIAARMGNLALGSTVVIWIAFFFLPALALSIGLGTPGLSFTFWDLTGMDVGVVGPVVSHGFWALIGVAAIAVPFAVPFLKMAWAKYLNAAPLAFVLLTFVKLWWGFRATSGGMPGMPTPSFFDIFSISWGFYILLIAALALAAQAVMSRKTA